MKKHPLQNRTNVQIKGGGGQRAFEQCSKKLHFSLAMASLIKLSKSPLYSPLPSEGTKVWRGDTGGGGEEVGFFIEVLTKDLHKDGDDGLEGNQWLSGNQLTLFHLVSTTSSTTAH